MSAVWMNYDVANVKAMGGSVAIHVLVAAWLLTTITPAQMLPQQMIQITMVAAPAKQEVKPDMAVEVKKPEAKKAMVKKPASPSSSVPVETKKLSQLSPSAGSNMFAEPTQMIVTKPLFDAAYLRNPAPDYPPHAKRRGMEGTVMLDVLVSRVGEAQAVRIAQTSGFAMLDESARLAVSRWKFIPAKRGNETVEARVMVPIEFRLE
jgi:protein TonB